MAKSIFTNDSTRLDVPAGKRVKTLIVDEYDGAEQVIVTLEDVPSVSRRLAVVTVER